MKAFTIKKYGKQPLELTEVNVPQIGKKDVLAEILTSSINPVDFKIKEGKLKILLNYKMPLILGNDFAGVITRIGADVTRFKIGDKIYSRVPKNRIGTFSEYIAVNQNAISLKPKNLTFEESASIPLVGLTSYQALIEVLNLQKGQKILIQAGSGGIGTIAIQLAKIIGAYVATTVSEKGYDLVKSLGADKIINYKKEKFEEVLKDYDAVFDTLGGDALKKSFIILKPKGKIVSISGLPNKKFGKKLNLGFFKTTLFSFISRKLTKLEKKYQVEYTFLFMRSSGKQLEYLAELIENEQLKPIVDKIFPFEEAQKALDYSMSGRAKGKIIIKKNYYQQSV